jgi:heme/copper-type cytochrome/quinol oxidase subunit 2
VNNISPETLDQLHALALQKLQSEIAIDQMWLTYNPLIIAGAGIIALLALIILVINELLFHRVKNYDSDARIYMNTGVVITLVICLITILCFGLGYFFANSDYLFITKSPDAATYQMVVYYLQYGVSR